MAVLNMTGKAGSGGGSDTSDATAYPINIEKGYTAYARGSKLTGTLKRAKPSVFGALWAETTGSKSLSLAIQAIIGVDIIAVVTTRSTTTFSAGWTTIASVTGFSTLNQNLYVLKKTASAVSESITVTQATSGRIYIELLCFSEVIALELLWSATSTVETSATVTPQNKEEDESILYALSANLWLTSSPYGNWISNPADIYRYSAITSVQDRQAVFYDNGDGAISRVFTAVANTGWGAIMLRVDTG